MPFRFGRRKHAIPREDPAFAQELATVERVSTKYAPGTKLSFGAPTRCPRCADFGLIEHVDVIAGRADNRCLRCGETWAITVRALLAHERRPGVPRRVAGTNRADARRSARAELEPRPDLPGVRFTRTEEGEVVKVPVQRATAPFPGESDLDKAAARTYQPPGRIGPMRILLVEDNPDDVEIVKAILESAGPEVIDLRTASTRASGEAVARASHPDLVLLDLGLPDSRGMATVSHWQEHVRDLPVVVVSGDLDREMKDQGTALGIAGVVDKAELVSFLELGDAGTHAFLDRLTSAASAR